MSADESLADRIFEGAFFGAAWLIALPFRIVLLVLTLLALLLITAVELACDW